MGKPAGSGGRRAGGWAFGRADIEGIGGEEVELDVRADPFGPALGVAGIDCLDDA